jgi:hypothetical protein
VGETAAGTRRRAWILRIKAGGVDGGDGLVVVGGAGEVDGRPSQRRDELAVLAAGV